MRNSEQFEVSLMKLPHKQKKFRCLRDKYMDNPSFRLLYSKFGPISPDDYLCNSVNNFRLLLELKPNCGLQSEPLLQSVTGSRPT